MIDYGSNGHSITQQNWVPASLQQCECILSLTCLSAHNASLLHEWNFMQLNDGSLY